MEAKYDSYIADYMKLPEQARCERFSTPDDAQ